MTMRGLVVTVGSSSIVLLPLHHHHHHRHHYHSQIVSSAGTNPLISSSSSSNLTPSKLPHPLPLQSTSPPRRRSKNRIKYFAELASKLAEDGRFEDFLLLAENVTASGEIKPSDFIALVNVDFVSAGVRRVIREKKASEVVLLLRSLEKLGISPLDLLGGVGSVVISEVVRRNVMSGELEEVVQFLEALSGFRFAIREITDSTEIVRLCIQNRNPDAAIRYACILPQSHILFCTMIHGFGKDGDLASALTVFEASKKYSNCPNMYAYRTMIDVCGFCGNYIKSRCIYEELLAKKVTPNIYVFNSLMNVNASDLGYTMEVYKHMQDLGVAADMTTYNILLKSCCLAARTDLAQDIYKEVQRLESTGVLKLDVFTYSTIVKVFADAKLWQMALKIKEDMQTSGVTPNIVTWSSLISACANTGHVEHAIQLFSDMLRAGCEPNSLCCNALLHACVDARQYDRAFRFFTSWKENGFQNAFASDLISKASGLNHINSPKKVPFKPTIATYNILMKACGTDYNRAKDLMDEMQTIGLTPNHISWSTLISICGESSRNVESAIQIFSSMREAGIQTDVIAYTTVIKICVEKKNLKMAFSLFGEMKKYQVKPNFVTYNTLLRARSRYGSWFEVQQCLGIYQDMRKAGYKPNDYYLKHLIEEWCEGVIQNTNKNQARFNSNKNIDSDGPHNFLLEKVAAHLQKRGGESLTVDLQGLTKVEARIVVLAVLRMIKENSDKGDTVKDDMLIILGTNEGGARFAKDVLEVKEPIIKLLQDELGLEVTSQGSTIVVDNRIDFPNPHRSYNKIPTTAAAVNKSTVDLQSSSRRPAVLQRLKVTRKSLNHWLQKRLDNNSNNIRF
ncbi:pentatricopeptide repeat-containing protein At5g02830, chloroplastic [Impatiens glandulifera]|uniref:pentatricopeptide repeat-containing protein At5g02830, chloroplastic n=1 Tax=Impatiens glandulifera TaxID=253017 RepID=UPI001FB08483|nr:pentatricopeptide repeat-containing protein At5g02830, chloroplastic [Impatiens glandulifera]